MARRSKYGPGRYRYELGKRNYSAKAVVDEFIITTEKRKLALTRQSLQDVIELANVPVAKGGKMRVDTGFLRNTGAATLNAPVMGPGRGDPNAPAGFYDNGNKLMGTSVTEALANLKLGDVFRFGWTANYAVYREAYDGFLESALMRWQKIVDRNVDIIRERVKK